MYTNMSDKTVEYSEFAVWGCLLVSFTAITSQSYLFFFGECKIYCMKAKPAKYPITMYPYIPTIKDLSTKNSRLTHLQVD